ncbi:unnamed protein product [Trifolium pratense]|uniref:Uncharacterized protein n=1 Tax=Trifolium pratense TaxID=57577 RepID=A0ACB0LB36_TRIPR|nr:unnamed protein product [Trifolium pratense]
MKYVGPKIESSGGISCWSPGILHEAIAKTKIVVFNGICSIHYIVMLFGIWMPISFYVISGPSSIKKDISPTPGIGSGVNYYWACSLRLSTSCLTYAEELPGSLVCVASASCCNSGMLGGLCARQSHHIADPRYHP